MNYIWHVVQDNFQSFVNSLSTVIHGLEPAADGNDGFNSDAAESLAKYLLGMPTSLDDKTHSPKLNEWV